MDNFLMSMRFNKQSPDDFGLAFKDGKFIRITDNTEWMPCELYDFGWGKENGFYKIPLGSFDELMLLALNCDDTEDSYGAAAMILEIYPLELKEYLLDYMDQKVSINDSFKRKKLSKKLAQIFRLGRGVNLTINMGMSAEQIDKEYADWCNIALFFKKYANKLYT